MSSAPNLDPQTVDSFGDEWQRFDQQAMATAEAERVFEDYFAYFPGISCPLMLKALIWAAAQAAGPAS